LSLTLDEEVQLRCAAFVQAESERFTEEVAVPSDVSDESGDERTSADEGVAPKKDAGRRSKNTTNGAKETGTTSLGTLIRAWT
jgi:hypothetical protein